MYSSLTWWRSYIKCASFHFHFTSCCRPTSFLFLSFFFSDDAQILHHTYGKQCTRPLHRRVKAECFLERVGEGVKTWEETFCLNFDKSKNATNCIAHKRLNCCHEMRYDCAECVMDRDLVQNVTRPCFTAMIRAERF